MIFDETLRMLPTLNAVFEQDGQIRRGLLTAFQRAGLGFDKDTLPKVKFDGSAENIGLLFHSPGQFNCRIDKIQTLFGEQTTMVTIHPDSLIENIESRLMGGEQLDRKRIEEVILLASLQLAIDTIVADAVNYNEPAFDKLSKRVFKEYLVIASQGTNK